MPLEKIKLRPGVTVEFTETLNEGGFSSSQLIRFFAGQLQKMGGWVRMPVAQLVGTCRGLFGWADLVGTAHLGVGTDQRLYVITAGVMSDISPALNVSNIAPALATIAGANVVTVTDPSATPKVGDTINLITAVGVGGIVLQGLYTVIGVPSGYTITAASPAVATQPSGGVVPVYSTTLNSSTITVVLPAHGFVVGSSYNATVSTTLATVVIFGNYTVSAVLDANTFRIPATTLANLTTSGGENGGLMQIQYLLPSGQGSSVSLGGWGTGDWGAGDWGKSTAGTTTALVTPPRTWSLDHFGQDLVASPDLGKIYHWSPPTVAPAVVIGSAAPIINKVVLAIAQVQIIMACGSEVGGSFFPTLIRWCDQGDFTTWVATTTNQAGSYQLPTGSYVIAAIAIGLGVLIWTDVGLWSVTYQGLPFVFGFNPIGVNCEAISKKAPAIVGSRVIWPSNRGFFTYDGNGVQPLECPVYDFFYNQLDPSQTDQVCSAVNSLFNEVAWYFPTVGGPISYVKWNFLENLWDYGVLSRTAWVDQSPYGNPIATDSQGILYHHEVGDDADGAPMIAYAQSGYYDLQDGNAETYTNTLVPDFLTDSPAGIQITVTAVDYPGDPPRTYGPFTVTPTSRRINCSIRGRQIALKIGSITMGGFWRMGALRYSRKAAGTRP
jgi:hypothetical protein